MGNYCLIADIWFNGISIHKIKFGTNPYFSRLKLKIYHLLNQRLFSISILTKKLSISLIFAISVIFEMNLAFSPVCQFLTYAVCYGFLCMVRPLLIFWGFACQLNVNIQQWEKLSVCISYLISFS